jgi:hypothetical protein
VPSQQPQGQLQTLHSVDTSNYPMDRHNIKSKTIKGKHWRRNILMRISKQTSKQANKQTDNNNNNNNNLVPVYYLLK